MDGGGALRLAPLLLALAVAPAAGFHTGITPPTARLLRPTPACRALPPRTTAAAAPAQAASPDLPPGLPANLGPYLRVKGRGVNAFGLLYGVQSVLIFGVMWSAAMAVWGIVARVLGVDPDRNFHDTIGKARAETPSSPCQTRSGSRWRV